MSRALPLFEQRPLGAYYTPDGVAVSCIDTLGDLRGLMAWEPHAGGGAFVRALRKAGCSEVMASDVDPACGWLIGDFLSFPAPLGDTDWIVGNPPYSEAEAHVRRALDLQPRRGAAFLLRLAFLESEKRAAFWREHRPSAVYVLTRRPSFTGGGTDSAAYGWFIWRNQVRKSDSETTLGWIR